MVNPEKNLNCQNDVSFSAILCQNLARKYKNISFDLFSVFHLYLYTTATTTKKIENEVAFIYCDMRVASKTNIFGKPSRRQVVGGYSFFGCPLRGDRDGFCQTVKGWMQSRAT